MSSQSISSPAMPPPQDDDTIYPFIQDLDLYQKFFGGQRAGLEQGQHDPHAHAALLDASEGLLEYCAFLKAKLKKKVSASLDSRSWKTIG